MKEKSSAKSLKDISPAIVNKDYGSTIECALCEIEKYVGDDRNKLLKLKADIQTRKDNCTILSPTSAAAFVVSTVAMIISLIPDNSCPMVVVKIIMGCVAYIGAIKIFSKTIKIIREAEITNDIQVALEEYEKTLEQKSNK